MRQKKALVLTNHLHAWAGSEILALEVCQVLQRLFSVTLVANVIAREMYQYAEENGFSITDCAESIVLHDYDVIWAQHYILPLCAGFNDLDSYRGSCNSVHLSSFTPFELASASYGVPLGANIVANSSETKNKLFEIVGDEPKIYNLNNATLAEFKSETLYSSAAGLNRIAIISNHIPPEIVRAAQIMGDLGVEVVAFGMGQNRYQRITPKIISEFDVIITIGKSVQYSILGRRPVFCYDHFGGPGYINTENFRESLDFNFSGRCCQRKVSAEQIVDEIITGFIAASSEINILSEEYADLFSLERFVDDLASRKTRLTVDNFSSKAVIETAKLIRELYKNGFK